MTFPATLHIFCRVIDNFGDVGVCWRLSRQFVAEHGIAAVLWIDDLGSLKRICRAVDADTELQQIDAVTIRRWPCDDAVFAPKDIPDVVVEAFACDLPSGYVTAMTQCAKAPVWLNLEYLSAETWIEGCHALPSPHPVLSLTKYFFFPGFTKKTGGLLRERDIFTMRDDFRQGLDEKSTFLAGLGVEAVPDAINVSLFCYHSAPAALLFDAMQTNDCPVLCLVPQGVASEAVSDFLGHPAMAGARHTRGALTVQVLPFVDQDDYDRLLWSCDLNFVRGEDSFLRAQWAGRPFIWHIYPQSENAHVAKLDAFLGRFVENLPTSTALLLVKFFLAWNGIRDMGSLSQQWRDLRHILPNLGDHTSVWAQALARQEDLASSLLRFSRQFG